MKKIIPALVLAALAQPAMAHARLTSSVPESGGHVRAVGKVVLTFSEKLEPAFSGAQLLGKTQKPVATPVAVSGTTITLITPGLTPGEYRVQWHSVGQDTHRMEGSFQFTVLP